MATLSVRATATDQWTELPEPDVEGYTVLYTDIDASTSGRDALGEMHRDRIATKRKLFISWSNRSIADIASILGSAITNTFFQCKFYDVKTQTEDTSWFYVGDRSAPIYSKALSIMGSYTCNFIER